MTAYIRWIGPIDGRMGPFSSHSLRKRLGGIVSFSYSRTISKCTHCCFVDKQQRIHGIIQARILEWIAISSSRGSSQPRDWIHVFQIGRQILYHWATLVALEACEATEKASEDTSSLLALGRALDWAVFPGIFISSACFILFTMIEPFLNVLLFT